MAWRLTSLGEGAARRARQTRGPEDAILVVLYTSSESSLELNEIAGELSMEDETAERVLRRMESAGYVKED